MDGWVDEWMGGSKSCFKDCLQQSKSAPEAYILIEKHFSM
jgi:hypothetical protein